MDVDRQCRLDLVRTKASPQLFSSHQTLYKDLLCLPATVTGGSVPNALHERCNVSRDSDVQGSSPLLLPDREHKPSPLTDLCFYTWQINSDKTLGSKHFGSARSVLQSLKQDASCGSYISLPGTEVRSTARQQDCESRGRVALTCSVDSAFRTAVMYISFFALVSKLTGRTIVHKTLWWAD